jgi:hypothetical protein
MLVIASAVKVRLCPLSGYDPLASFSKHVSSKR